MTSRIAVVAPVYRNAATLPALVARTQNALGSDWRLRLVVDACPEGSAEEALRLAATDERIRVTVLARNVGQHRAIIEGLLSEDDADAWVCLDADLQDPPEAIPHLVTLLRPGQVAGAIAGRRGAYQARGRRATGEVHRRLLAQLVPLPPDAGAYFAMDRALRDAVVAGVRDQGAPSVVVAAGASGLPLISVPVERHRRPEGTSAWTSRARVWQSVRTLTWALKHRAAT